MTDPLRDVTHGPAPKKENFLAGRASRKEYWIFVGIVTGLSIVFGLMNLDIGSGASTGVMLIVNIRRFHDLGRSGWWALALMVGQLAVMIPLMILGGPELGLVLALLVAVAALVVMGVLPGQPFENRFGPPAGDRKLSEIFR